MSTVPEPGHVLALRRAEQDRLRAERLARLREGPSGAAAKEVSASAVLTLPRPEDGRDAEEAMHDFLKALLGDEVPAATAEVAPPIPQAPPGCDLDRLPGVGPGLVRALRRAGLGGLVEVARLGPDQLATRLGPIGRLVPAESWVATAAVANRPSQPGA